MQIKALFNNVAAWVKTKARQINYLQCFLAYPYPNLYFFEIVVFVWGLASR